MSWTSPVLARLLKEIKYMLPLCWSVPVLLLCDITWWRKPDLNQIWLLDEGLKDIAVLQISQEEAVQQRENKSVLPLGKILQN